TISALSRRLHQLVHVTQKSRILNHASALWNVTRSTSPARRSGSGLGVTLGGLADMKEARLVVLLLKR
ncbi:hypothetical protein, partial [Paraburkholderia sp. UYCP14C]|uniref:hypothetical protein n=1 Tax=Paraburkholderia sp. UYCP14C TaxID=2511130 RepID=UPI001B7D51F9